MPTQTLFARALFWATILVVFVAWDSVHCSQIRPKIPVTTDTKLCPGQRLYFNQTRKCYISGTEGPCGELTLLRPAYNDNVNVGVCNECKRTNIESYHDCPSSAWPLVFVSESSRCYPIFEQGPCQAGEWLVVNKDDSPVCEKIPCPDKYYAQSPSLVLNGTRWNEDETTFVFADAGNCYTTGNKSMGQGKCKADEFMYFDDLSFSPNCKKDIGCVHLPPALAPPAVATNNVNNDCAMQSEPDFQGGCEPIAEI